MTDGQFKKLAELYGFAPSRALRELVEAVERMNGGAFAQTLQDRLDEALEQRGALLEALKFVIRGVPDTWEGVQKARAAIAKAEAA